MGMKSPLRILACVLATLLLTPSLFGQKADFIFVNRGDVGTLDPNRMSWMQDIRIGYALWEGLYALDPDSLLTASLEKRLRGRERIADDREFQRLFRYLMAQGFDTDKVLALLRKYQPR